MCVIETEGLSKRYGTRVGIDDLTLSVPAGTIFGFIGPNGAGKTTTIRILMGLLRPTSGRARILGHDCWSDGPAIKREIGYLSGDLRLYPWMTTRSALAIFGKARGHDVRAAGEELAAVFGLDVTVRVRAMSRGMRQKLGLILALAHEPELLILDEPTTALDPLHQETLYELLHARARRGGTIFFSSHVLSEVEGLCERVAILREGALVADEKLETLRVRAGRIVTIRWPPETTGPEDVPPFLTVHERHDDLWRCSLRSPVPELLAWLERHPVADLSISPPDLDSLFLSYYRDEGVRA